MNCKAHCWCKRAQARQRLCPYQSDVYVNSEVRQRGAARIGCPALCLSTARPSRLRLDVGVLNQELVENVPRGLFVSRWLEYLLDLYVGGEWPRQRLCAGRGWARS